MFNLADAGDNDEETIVLRTGRVHGYNSPVNLAEVKPFHILKVNIQFSMAPVLTSIAEKWSPIETMKFHCIYFIIYNDLMRETNPQISVYEQGEWINKGQYTAAVKFNEDVEWIKEKRDYILPVCYVRYLYSIQINQHLFHIRNSNLNWFQHFQLYLSQLLHLPPVALHPLLVLALHIKTR